MIVPRTTPPYKLGLVLLAPLVLGGGAALCHRPEPCRFQPPPRRAIATQVERSPIACAGNHCVVDRRRIEGILAVPSSFGSIVRVVPSVLDAGRTNYYLVGVRAGSVAARLGLRDGDRVARVNGRTFRYPEDALAQYFQVKHADRVTLDVVRNDRLMRFDYEIR